MENLKNVPELYYEHSLREDTDRNINHKLLTVDSNSSTNNKIT